MISFLSATVYIAYSPWFSLSDNHCRVSFFIKGHIPNTNFLSFYDGNAIFIYSAPSSPLVSKPCDVKDSTTSICVSWTKPNGGNMIDVYILSMMAVNGDDIGQISRYVSHKKNQSEYSEITTDLFPGEKMKFLVEAQNSAGSGVSGLLIYATSKYAYCVKLTMLL